MTTITIPGTSGRTGASLDPGLLPDRDRQTRNVDLAICPARPAGIHMTA